MQFAYDSWGRLRNITYPDDEVSLRFIILYRDGILYVHYFQIVYYYYNNASQLTSVVGNRLDKNYTYPFCLFILFMLHNISIYISLKCY